MENYCLCSRCEFHCLTHFGLECSVLSFLQGTNHFITTSFFGNIGGERINSF